MNHYNKIWATLETNKKIFFQNISLSTYNTLRVTLFRKKFQSDGEMATLFEDAFEAEILCTSYNAEKKLAKFWLETKEIYEKKKETKHNYIILLEDPSLSENKEEKKEINKENKEIKGEGDADQEK